MHGLTIETHYSPDGHVIACMNDIGDKVQADAHLITAAPMMYEALKDIYDFLKHSGYRTDIVKEALAKAEGKGL